MYKEAYNPVNQNFLSFHVLQQFSKNLEVAYNVGVINVNTKKWLEIRSPNELIILQNSQYAT